MRITGGKLGGRKLIAPEDISVRPTSDRSRQAIFNILRHKDFGIGFELEGAAVADLFAGTGALGIEALSQGARWCLLVDDSADSRAIQRENIEALGLTWLAAEGRDPDGGWDVEPSLVALGLTFDQACALGDEFGQNAVLFAGADGAMRLVFCLLGRSET